MSSSDTNTGKAPANREAMIVLSYLWLLALVPLFLEAHDEDVRRHAKLGLVLFLVEMVVAIPFSIIQLALGTIFGIMFAAMLAPLVLAVIALHATAILMGLNGKRLTVPGLSGLADRL